MHYLQVTSFHKHLFISINNNNNNDNNNTVLKTILCRVQLLKKTSPSTKRRPRISAALRREKLFVQTR